MTLTRHLFHRYLFRLFYRRSSAITSNSPFVKVLTSDDEEIKLSFKYANSQNINLSVKKDESSQGVLSLIKKRAELQHRKNEIISKYQSQIVVEKIRDMDVGLYEDNTLLDSSLVNSEAWTRASALKIGDVVFEVKCNMPTITQLNLPDYILCGCPIRPHIRFENTSIEECTFTWYRSLTEDEATAIIDERKDDIYVENSTSWLKCGNELIYCTSKDDVGRYLKVICVPRAKDQEGFACSTTSPTAVELGPDVFPFEERHAYTKEFADDSSIRCMSYNILASIYVEKRKFPYASEIARNRYYRTQLLLKELIGYNCDVICLQEVQEKTFEFDLAPMLRKVGYKGVYTKKGGQRYEGLATFVRTSKFKISKKDRILLNRLQNNDIFKDLLKNVWGNFKDMSKLLAQDHTFQVLLLEHVDYPKRQILVANTHLYSNKNTPEVRLIQAAICTHYLEEDIIKKNNLQSVPLLFCGDFNSMPTSTAYSFVVNGSYECCPSWSVKNSDSNTGNIIKHNLCLDSACGTPEYTNYTEEFQGCLDYIFYTKKLLDVTEVVPMPKHEHVTAHVALPSELFPSDHIPLICTLRYKDL